MKIVFDSEKVNEWRQRIHQFAKELHEQELRLCSIVNGLNMEIAARGEIEWRLKGLCDKARKLREGLDAMAELILQAESAYLDAERESAALLSELTAEWKESDRRLAPALSRAKLGLTTAEMQQLYAIRALDGLFMDRLHMDFENYTAHFEPLQIKFELLPE